jgi:glycosyltransferase involved in cell wall biosynthesis
MKILHVLRSPVGGLFRHVVDLANGQIQRGHEVGLVTDSTTGNALSEAALKALAPKLALGLCQFPIRRNPHWSDLAAVWQVTRQIRSTGAEIVHGHGAKGGALARLAPSRNVLRAYTPHGGSLHDAVGNRLHLLLERMLMRRGQLYLFESAYSQAAYRRKVGQPDALVAVVPNGIRVEELQPVTLDPAASDLVYLGELRALKGVDVLVESIALLHRTGRKVSAKLFGDGPLRAKLQAQIEKLELDEYVKLCAPVPAREALSHGRIVMLPSRAESMPYVILEAVAAGKPVVATKVGGIPEIFGPHVDRLIAPGDPTALATAIVAAIDDAAGGMTAQALRARVASEFSVDAMVNAILNCYQSARAVSAKALKLRAPSALRTSC